MDWVNNEVHYQKSDSECHPSSTPIYQTSTFHYDSFNGLKSALERGSSRYLYSKMSNPTVRELEKAISELEGAEDCRVFPSGISAITCMLLTFMSSGDHAVCVDDCYSGTKRVFSNYLGRLGITVTFVDGRSVGDWEEAIQTNTKLFFLESPTSFTLKQQDISQVSSLARSRGIKTVIDNTWATPLFQSPLAMGVDIVIQSCSKYLSGHSDVIAGAVAGSFYDIELVKMTSISLGYSASPSDSWLVIRGLQTLDIRMERHQENVKTVLDFLSTTDNVTCEHPLLASYEQYDLSQQQLSGSGGLFTMKLHSVDYKDVQRFVDSLRVFKKAISWGGVASQVLPMAACEDCSDEQMGIVRTFVGTEPPQALIKDLEKAVNVLAK